MLVYVGFFILTFVGGVFSGHKPPKCDSDPSCPNNEHYTRNNPRCIRTCANKWVPISDGCKPFTGCVCDDDLVRLNDDASGPCVPAQKCPCRDDPKNPDNPKNQENTAHTEAEASAVVILVDTNGKSFSHASAKASSHSESSSSNTPDISSNCGGKKCKDPHAVFKDCPNPCPLTCANPNPRPCPFMCINKGGCECAPGYVLNEATGRCVRPKDCPGIKCKDPNAVYKPCPNPCPTSCDDPVPKQVCTRACVEFGCECAPGFILDVNDISGKCVRPEDCPGKKCKDPNAVYKPCPNPCPVSCDDPFPKQVCTRACVRFGCECAPGFILDTMSGKCVRPEDCPVPIRCPKHSHYVLNDNQCPKTCGNRLLPNSDVAGACVPFTGCVCNCNFVKKYDNATGPCIPKKECPPIPKRCGINETRTSCRIICPPQTCESIYSKYYCLPTECEPGCDCLNGFLRNKDGICIPSDDCFKSEPIECGVNEIPSHCAIVCPPQSCESLFTTYMCAETNCTPGCNCIDGYLRNSRGICVPSDECYTDPGAGCDGDLNATRVRGCSDACPPTCKKPNPKVCDTICILNGCDCKPEYIRSCAGGKCIDPKDCPGGAPICGANRTYVGCKINCPTNYCPADDSRAQVACSLPYPCRGGCACKAGHLIVSREDPRCVLGSDCPEVKCTRPNEVWDRNPSSCFLERCEDRGSVCDYPVPFPGPRCVCKKGFYRNEDDVCIPASECPPMGCKGDMNATLKQCPSPCPKTCDDPNAGSEGCPDICLPDDCECNPGFVLTKKKGGICIKLEDCPGCGGDPNAEYKECPSACEPTCTNPNPRICTEQCLPSGCVCKPGFVKNEKTGKCIKPENCPVVGCNGDPNATYKECTSMCPLTCAEPDPRPCIQVCGPSGCECNPGYVLNEDGKCIDPADCPVVDKGCNGDLNATHSDCPSSCPPTCANLYSKEKVFCPAVCDPSGCVCKQGYILTKKGGKCVKPEDCPVKDCGGDPNAEYKECPSACEPTCSNPDPNQICTAQCMPSGCVCKPGFVLNEKDGKCIKPESCPADSGCKGDMNATYSECPSACPKTCADRNSNGDSAACPAVCDPPGCVCKPGYIFTVKGGICIKPEDCPEIGCKGDPNAEYSDCPSACQATCDKPDSSQPCTRECLPRGCVCKAGFIRIEKGGKCIKPENCLVPGCGGDPNAVYKECPSACEPSCANPNPEICTMQCMPSGCVCKPGYVLSKKGGKCIKPENCPDLCKGDRNATFSECPRYIQPTCKHPDVDGLGNDTCMPPGCVCKEGHLLNKKGGKCIKPEDCPGGWPTCRANETYVYCKVGCPNNYCPVDDSLAIIACDPIYPCPGGCACKGGYLMVSVEDDRCILSSECPEVECTRPNEVWDANAPGCLHERCDDKDIPCDFQYPGPPRCRCIKGYYRNQDDVCVPESQCPQKGCNGDMNATFSDCPSKCPATCCDPDPICTKDCADPGCVCNEGFIRSEPGGPCTRPYDCEGGSPVCCDNMTYVNCKIDCPMKYCPEDENEVFVICDPVWPCPSGCACKPGYLMPSKADKRCILAADCPPRECTRPNEVWDPSPSNCNYERCDQMYYTCGDTNPGRPKCVCKEGYYRDNNGVCIPAEECPKPKCGYNEVEVPCRQICPPQSCEIAYTDYVCTEESKICEPGCNCLPDHLRNGSGICIPSDQCPYPSNPVCGINEIAKDCRRICPPQTCLSKYALFLCVEGLPCEPGCDCIPNYLRNDKGICIPSEQCPPLEPICGYNEVAVPCRQICPPQNCEIAYTDYACTNESKICEPGCDCLPDHLRNGSGICIPNDQCPPPCQIPDECKRTCAEPNPPNCEYNPPKVNMNGCDCKEGYILSELGGDCIPIDQCPPEIPCHGDPNARPKLCPKPCPSTCKVPNQVPCLKLCEPIACECKPGYILSNATGRCILPDKCRGGNPCGKNAHFVDCKTDCPRDYCPVNDNRDSSCDPSPADECLSGCTCNLNHRRKSREDPRCIVSSDCPPVNCTRPNEVWCSCPSACLAENCEDVNNQPTVCNTLVLNCDPRCICKKDHFRNASGICIPAEDCPKGCNGDMNATFSECPSKCPATCCDRDPICTADCADPGCVCNEGFILSEPGGSCIKPCDCPAEKGCNGDMNATFSECPSRCPATCCDRDPICTADCADPGCVCNEGFILSEPGGSCIKPCDCPAEKGCNGDMNATFSECPSRCPATCCDRDPICTADCADPGCVCNEGFILSEPGGSCIKPCDCPAEKGCNGDMNATYSDCPSKCPATCCDPDPTCTKDCADPGCVCNEGFIQSEPGGPCIRPYDCEGGSPLCGDNMTYVNCKIECPMKYCPEDENEVLVICDPVWPCPSGCECKPGYLMRNRADKRCILAADCPTRECTRPNEVWDPSPSNCNYESCDQMYYTCDDTNPGRPKCVCKEGYYRDKDGVCIPAEECPKPKCGYNEVEVPCRQICPPQNCEIAYTDYACTEESKICEPGCNCLPDHLRNGSGICIPSDKCPYPSTPVCGINEIARDCRRICPPQTCLSKYALFRCVDDLPCEPGCDCVPNYLRDDKGICIPSEQCPPLEPICGYNEVAVPCRQICPPQNCEIAYTEYACTNESKICEPGCDCLPDHLRNGSGICIPNKECPYPSTPVCGINEIARDCRRICPPQTCLSKYALFKCVADLPCEPGCDCVPNYLRDDRGICIPSEQCPPPCQVPDACKRTCADPNPPDCDYNPPIVNMNGCDCKEGYILSELGGDCIPIDECSPEIPCQGDPNASPKRCPKPCPSTCKSPNQFPCKRMCEAIGCQCKPGYILSDDTGLCILPDKCPGGNPCGKNAHFVDCKTDCPADYCPVNDNRDLVFCDPPAGDCLSGCICNLNHRRKSREDPRCIVSSDCPRINCTRPNEKWSPCPSACLAENCEDVNNQPTVCYPLVLNCDPRCICKKNYFRNSSGICIPAKDCPIGCDGDPYAVYSECPSACEPTCTRPKPEICTADCKPPGCVCKEGYVLNEEDGKCVVPEDCPGCGGDPNAVFKDCRSACEPTCANPNPEVCTDESKPSGCVCKPGFVLNEEDGRCISPESCPDC